VTGAEEDDDTTMKFDPREFMECDLSPPRRPNFLAIVSSNTLATTMLKRANGAVNGFIIEEPTAGGHNAPPRGKLQLDEAGEPIYGGRDRVDLPKIRELGPPFWLAGGYGSPEKFREALAAGAAGVQVGTAFAYCAESGLREDYKQALLTKVISGDARVVTDSLSSPTGFPFKVAQLEGSLSEDEIYSARPRICDLGYLREAYKNTDGKIGYRCPGEPVSVYVSKGGEPENTVGRKCLCNSLMATIGHPQIRNGKYIERGLVTSGDDLTGITRFLPANRSTYSAADVVKEMMSIFDERSSLVGCGLTGGIQVSPEWGSP
jgi:nitronate monooxygenase